MASDAQHPSTSDAIDEARSGDKRHRGARVDSAVILSGGLGARLRPFTEVIPKPLLPLGEKSLMEVQILWLKRHGVQRIYVATNYLSQYVEAFLGNGDKYGVEIVFSKEQKPLGTAGPLSLLRGVLDKPFFVVNGDILTKADLGTLATFALEQPSLMTVATKIITTPFRFGNVTVDENDIIVDVEEKPELSFEVLSGIYCMKPQVLAHIPDDCYFGMDQLIRTLVRQRYPISRYSIREYWIDIGQFEDYSEARKVYQNHFVESAQTAPVTLPAPSTPM
jgi:NDP-sugar pyrophosphorylase family protein